MEIGFIVRIIVAIAVLCSGVIGLIVSNHKGKKNKWAWGAIVFGGCALISAVINSKILFYINN